MALEKLLSTAAVAILAFAQPISAGLVAHWTFDEGVGAAASDSGPHNLDATLEGGVSWAEGKAGNAVHFHGVSSDRVVMPVDDALDITSSVTVAVWTKRTGTTNYGIFAGIDTSGGTTNDQYVLKTTASSNNENIQFQVTGASTATVSSTRGFQELSSLSEDGWVHLVGVYDAGSSVRLYVNGELESVVTNNVPASLQSKIAVAPFKSGMMTLPTANSSYFLNGLVDDIQVYDHALSAADVAWLYNNPGETVVPEGSNPNPVAGLVAHWDFEEGTGTTATDIGESALVGTLQGNAQWTEGKFGTGVQFGRNSVDQVLVGTPEELNITEAVTVMAWVQPLNTSNYGVIAGIDQGGGATNDQYVLKTTVSTSSKLTFQITNPSGNAITVTDPLLLLERASGTEDGWVHVAGVFIPGQAVVLYVDGEEVARSATSATVMQSKLSEAVPFRIGNMTSNPNNDYGFNGVIDEVQVYNVALTANEVRAAAGLSEGPGGEEPPPPAGEFVFSFGAVADPQYEDKNPSGSRFYRNSIQKLTDMVADFNDRDLTFVVCLGDFIDTGFESFEPMMAIWRDIIHDRYHVIGNHDLSVSSAYKDLVAETLEMPAPYYDFEYYGWRFFVIDGNDAGYGIHSDEQLSWLRDGLDQALAAGENVIVFSHYPAYPPGTPHISPQGPSLVALLEDYPNIRAWMNGHNHNGAYGHKEGIHYLNLQGMVETAATTAYAEIEVWTDRLEVKGVGREPNRTLLFPVLSNAVEAPTSVIATTDAGGGAHISWQASVTEGVTGYEIQRRVSGSNTNFTVIVPNNAASQTSYTDNTVESGVTYVYRVRAKKDSDVSGWSATTNFEVGFLEGEITGTATAISSSEVSVSWDVNGVTYDSLILQRRQAPFGEYVTLAGDLAGSVLSYDDSGLAPNTTYEYRISGRLGGQQTDWSTVFAATTEASQGGGDEGPAGLVGYWPFDEGVGTDIGDFSGNGLGGIIQGNPVWTAGKTGSALRFARNANDQVNLGYPAALNITGAVTVSAWIKPLGVSNYGVIAGIDKSGGATDDQFVLKTTQAATHLLTFQVTHNGNQVNATDTVDLLERAAFSDDGWLHVAGVFIPGQEVTLYVDGIKVHSNSLSFTQMQSKLSAAIPFRIGNMTNSTDFGFNGVIDEVRVYANALTQQEIAVLADVETTGVDPLLPIPRKSVWKYLDNGVDMGTAWREPEFDDSSWSSGPGELGYGDGDEATVLSYGSSSSNKHITYYFRREFTVNNLENYTAATLRVLRDDGVVVYINGTEVVRDNLPDGEITYSTLALVAIDYEAEKAYNEFLIPLETFVEGENSIAVEIHQQRANSSDISFDLELAMETRDITGGGAKKLRVVWQTDPATTATIGWSQEMGNDPVVHYGKVDHGQDHEAYEFSQSPDRTVSFKGMDNRYVRLTDLEPDTAYYFVIKDSFGVSERYWFMTAPDHARPFTFIAGGDSRNNRVPRQNANKMVPKLRPLFISFNGDMTDQDTNAEWQEWFDDWQLTFGEDGRIFPVIPVRGNHERSDSVIVNLFDCIYPEVYYAMSIADDLMRIYTLNSEMFAGGNQSAWLAQDLAEHAANHQHLVVNYHKPIRPHNRGKAEGHDRYEHWAPLFDQYKVDLVVESDSHMIKRTYPVRATMESGHSEGFIRDDENGVLYIGEGCWGAPLRANDDDKPWTMASDSFNGFDLIHVYLDRMEVRTVRTDSVNVTSGITDADPFAIPEGIQLWAPPTGIVLHVPFVPQPEPESYTLIPAGAVWKYLDDGSDQGTAWRAPDFDDSSWAAGPAELGYGDGDEATVISYGGNSSNKHITYYFRHRFNVDRPDRVTLLRLNLLRDDGAVVYLNGQEILRDNMPLGEINYMTWASSTIDGSAETIFHAFQVDHTLLLPGENVMAVEVHNRDHSSSDISFNMSLRGDADGPVFLLAYEDWLNEHGGLTHDQSGPNADPDGDGIPNFLEYALGTDPNSPDMANVPVLSMESGADVMEFTFSRRMDANATYTMMSSPDMGTWSEMTEGVHYTMETERIDSTNNEKVTVRIQNNGAQKMFMRLRIQNAANN